MLCRYAGRWFSIPQRLCLPDELMWSERFEAESTSRRSSCAHRVDVLPAHMLVPVLLKRSAQRISVRIKTRIMIQSFQRYHYLSSPSPPSSARIDSLSSLLVVEVTGGGLGAKLFPVLAVGYPPPSPPDTPDTLPLDELTGLLVVYAGPATAEGKAEAEE